MDFAFVVDPLDALKPAKDSSIAMMREAARRGHGIFAIEPDGLALVDGSVLGQARALTLGDGESWCRAADPVARRLADFDAVLMRKDPPLDIEYIAATWLLEHAENEGAHVVNRPRALRDHSEKFAVAEFPALTVPAVVARDPAIIDAFIDAEGDVILKPLDGMGGSRIFRVRHDDPNRNVIIETLGKDGRRTFLAQRFIPEIAAGDKRILILGGVVVPQALARVPKPGETRGNLATGGRGTAQPLSVRDREIAEAVAATLTPRGLLLIGIDVIGDWLTEINVTSPTCFVEIEQQTAYPVAATAIDAVEAACK